MDTGELAIIVAVGVGFAANLIALFAFMWMSRSESRSERRESRSEMRELRSEIREQGNRLGERISEVERERRSEIRELRSEIRDQSNRLGERISEAEREQARLEGANSVLSEALTRHFHTHEPNDAAAD